MRTIKSQQSYQNSLKNEHKRGVADFFSESSYYWNEIYDNPDVCYNLDHSTVVARQEEVLRMICSDKQFTGIILEAGCGAGQLLQRLTKKGFNVIGLDFALQMVKATHERLRNDQHLIGCVVGDIEHLPFKSGTFAAVASVGVLQYLTCDKQCIEEFCRVVNKSGKIVVTLPNLFRLSNFVDPAYIIRLFDFLISKIRNKFVKKMPRFSSHDYYINRTFASRRYVLGQLNSIFKHFGFSHIETAAIGFGPFTVFKRQLFPQSLSLKISALFQNSSKKPRLKWLACFGNRWVHSYGYQPKNHSEN